MEGLPIAQGPADILRDGFSSLEAKMNAPHPVQTIETRASDVDLREKLLRVRSIYGSHLAMRIATEKEMFSRPRRLPGLPSSRASLDIVMGTENRIEFSDFLNDPKNRPDAPRVDFHDVIGM
jgi:proteasome maturation protein